MQGKEKRGKEGRKEDKPKISALTDSVFVRTHFLVHRWCLLAVYSHDRRGKGVLWGSCYEATNLTHKDSIFMT